MGLASYPRISGKEVPYLTERLKTYRAGTKVGPNSDLMIMMAKPLTDLEIETRFGCGIYTFEKVK